MGPAGTPRSPGFGTRRAARRARPRRFRTPRSSGPGPPASRDHQLIELSDAGQFATRRVPVQVDQMFLDIVQAVTLGPVAGIIEQLTEEGIPVLPADESDGLHRDGAPQVDCTPGRRPR